MTRSLPRRAFIRRSVLIPVALGLATASLLLSPPALGIAAPAPPVAPAPPPFIPWWVQNFQPTHLWSSPTGAAVDYGAIPQWSYLQVMSPQSSPRLYVYVPWTKNFAYVDATSVGPTGPPPPAWAQAIVDNGQPNPNSPNWVGRVADAGLLERRAPSAQSPVLQTLPAGTVVQVVSWVAGDEIVFGDWTWAKLADGNYGYGRALRIVPPTIPPPLPPDHPSGKWIDINVLHQTAVAYQDTTPVHLAIVSTGSPGWETPVGLHAIQERVADETMDGSTLNHLTMDAWHAAHISYKLDHVLFTQYFDGLGDALHDNYWLPSTSFGVPHSHGCVGMQLADAQWFWNWADYGVSVLVRAT